MKKMQAPSSFNPVDISRFRKEKYLRGFSEDEFRDKVVRPIFLRRGYLDGRDLCGKDEQGKDAIFFDTNKLGLKECWAVQTKKGNINLSGKADQNIVNITTQLKTALETKIVLLETRQKIHPNYVVLCASGKINQSAKIHILGNINDNRIVFIDSDSLIPMIDEYYPEFWWEIDADRFPYLKNLRSSLLNTSDTLSLLEIQDDNKAALAPVSDEMYVSLYLHRMTTETSKYRGKIIQEPKLEQIPIYGILNRKESLIHIMGEAGAGKTTALRRFAYTIANKALTDQNAKIIPIILKCVDVAARDSDLLTIMSNATLQFVTSNKPCFSEEDLCKGNILVLIDALDEVPAIDRDKVVTKVIKFHEKYGLCKVILTSRDYSSITNMVSLKIFTRYNLTPIDLKQAQEMLERLSKGKPTPKTQTKEILRQLSEVHGLDLNPLLVTVFVASTDYSRRDIPANITELFKKFTEMMMGRWDQKKGMSQQYQSQVKDFLLKRLGFYMHSNHLVLLPLSNCKEIFSMELKELGYEADLDVMFEECIYRSGLFKIEDDNLSFKHTLLQEFFAGRGVPAVSFFQGVINNDWWKNPLVFYFGEHPDSHLELMSLISGVNNYDGFNLYWSAVAIGLAIQACYLAKVNEKKVSMKWVIEALARSKEGVIKTLIEHKQHYALSSFLSYYIHGRDSVACEQTKEEIFKNTEELIKNCKQEEELVIFWNLVSLIESGSLDRVETLLHKFKPQDLTLLLALHMGCFLISELRVTSHEEKKTAKRICDHLGAKTHFLKKQVISEMKSMILEVRKGEIKAVENRVLDESKTDE